MNDLSKIYYNMYQSENEEKFNEDLIYLKDKEDITTFAEAIGKGLEILPGIKYLNTTKIDRKKVYNNTATEKKIDVEPSILEEISINFLIFKGEKGDEDYEEREISLKFYFPKLIDHHFFIINGIKYKMIYQLTDSGTYRNKKYLVLKNLVMPIKLGTETKVFKFEDTEGNIYNQKVFCINMFKRTINPFLYYFSKLRYEDTIKYLGLDDYVELIDLNEYDFIEGCTNFKISNSLGVSIDTEFLNESEENKLLIFSYLNIFTNRMKYEKIMDKDFWIKTLGSIFTKNPSAVLEKGVNILISFERSLDEITKMILRIPDSDKENVYAIVRWMMRNYITLSKLDVMDLSFKRLRLREYLIYPLLTRLSDGVYRLLNKKNPSLNDINSIFKIPKGFLINYLVKSETIQYVNAVNTYDLFSVALKGTLSGPQSPFQGNSDNMKLRSIHPSYLGRLDLISTSTGDPGVSFTLVPFLHMYKDMHFTEEIDLDLVEDEDDSMKIPNTMIDEYFDDSYEKDDD